MRPRFLRGEARCFAPRAFRADAAARVLLSAFLILGALVCSNAFPSEQMDYASLLANLRAAGVRATSAGKVVQPFFSVNGRTIRVNGEEVQVFQHRDAARADAQAALISRDGSTIGTTKVHWLGPPHFYKRERLLVLYIGGNGQVVRALEAALGRQFAGKQD